jgi:hypothetical protein
MDPANRSRAGIAAELAKRAREEIRTPMLFRPVAAMVGGNATNLVGEKRLGAARAVFEASILRPIVDACAVNLKKDAEGGAKLPESAASAEKQLRLVGESLASGKAPTIDFGTLLRYALRNTNDFAEKKVVGDLPAIEEGYRALYVEPGFWPPATMKPGYGGLASVVVASAPVNPTTPKVQPDPVVPPKVDPPKTDPPKVGTGPAGLKFPLAVFAGAGSEMTLVDLAALREQVEKVRSGGQVPAEWRKAEAMLKALPSAQGRTKQMCTITVLPGEPASLGKTGLAGDAPFVSIARVGAKSGKPAAMAGQTEVKLAKLPGPGEPFEVRFYSSAAADSPVATVTVPSVWGGMWLVEKFGGQPTKAGDRTTWDVEVEAGTKDGPKTVWVRLEFDAELPEMPWW